MMNNPKRNIILIVSLLALVPFYLLSREAFIAAAQARDSSKKEIKQASFPEEPVEIIEISNQENPKLKLGVKFEQTNNWLKDFSVKLKNNTNKRIAFLMMVMEFPETKKSGNEIAVPLTFGSNPLLENKGEIIQLIQPGEIFELKVTEKKFNSLKNAFESRHSLDSLSLLVLRLDIIHFDDGTVWSGGAFSKPVSGKTKNQPSILLNETRNFYK